MMLEKVVNLAIYSKKKPIGVNSESFVREFFRKKGYNVIKKNGVPPGIPDFLCEKENEKFYVEVKNEGDSLRITQLKWIKENYKEPVIIFIVEEKQFKKVCKKCGSEDYPYHKKGCNGGFTLK